MREKAAKHERLASDCVYNTAAFFEIPDDHLTCLLKSADVGNRNPDSNVSGVPFQSREQELPPEVLPTVFHPEEGRGGKRTITAPAGYLKGAQKAISVLLSLLYSAPEMVNGFTAGRSVETNAEAHMGKNYVFNTDLKDFFPSITARMVRHALEDLGVKPEVARYISVLCTITTEGDDLPEDVLPQGSPASPVLSNIVCRNMDRHIDWLARKYGVTYTRYADDMTMSSMHSVYGKNSTFL